MEFTGPSDVTGTLFLHLSPRGDTDQQWLWTPATRRARRLADAQRDENFMGTDLSYRDLELIVRIQQWNDAESTATLLPEETLDGKACQVVELMPKNQEFSYSKYRLWFGKDDALLEQVEVYDADAKVFQTHAHARLQAHPELRHCPGGGGVERPVQHAHAVQDQQRALRLGRARFAVHGGERPAGALGSPAARWRFVAA